MCYAHSDDITRVVLRYVKAKEIDRRDLETDLRLLVDSPVYY